MTFRKTLFWIHLVAGVISGLSIGIMCFTGAALAFEKELIAWSERDARQVAPPAAGAARLSLDELQRKLREAQPEARPMSIVLQNDPTAAVAFSTGRSGGFYVNPYTGEVRQPKSGAMAGFMHTMTDLHRYLALTGETARPRGKLINGICNIAFCGLAITGLYLWMPRSWSWRGLRPVVWFTQNSSIKARDWNWHNVIGFWTAPVLIVLTLTAMPISFRWAGNAISRLAGETPSENTGAARPGGPAAAPAVELPAPPPNAKPLGADALLAVVEKEIPRWKQITLRLGGGGGGRPGGGGGRPANADTGRDGREGGGESRRTGPQAVTFTVREQGSWPRTATTTLSLNPFSGEIARREGYADLARSRQIRGWTRFLHTGEALGPVGQLVAGLASFGGVVLVWTGFALAFRRFFNRRNYAPAPDAANREREPVAAR